MKSWHTIAICGHGYDSLNDDDDDNDDEDEPTSSASPLATLATLAATLSRANSASRWRILRSLEPWKYGIWWRQGKAVLLIKTFKKDIQGQGCSEKSKNLLKPQLRFHVDFFSFETQRMFWVQNDSEASSGLPRHLCMFDKIRRLWAPGLWFD